MNKEIDALVDELFQKVCLNMADRVSDHSTIKSYLVEWGQSERERALEEAAEACEKLAMNGNEKSIYVGAFEYAIAVHALKGE